MKGGLVLVCVKFVVDLPEKCVFWRKNAEKCWFLHLFVLVYRGAQKCVFFCSFLQFFAKLKISDVKRRVFLKKNRREIITVNGER